MVPGFHRLHRVDGFVLPFSFPLVLKRSACASIALVRFLPRRLFALHAGPDSGVTGSRRESLKGPLPPALSSMTLLASTVQMTIAGLRDDHEPVQGAAITEEFRDALHRDVLPGASIGLDQSADDFATLFSVAEDEGTFRLLDLAEGAEGL
jgi:hypothetical protein